MKLFTSLLFYLIVFVAYGQRYEDVNNPDEIKSIFSQENEIEGFGGADVKLSDILNERTFLVGGYGGVIVNRSFMLGLGAYGLATQPSFSGTIPGTANTKELRLYGGYGGVLVGATFFGKEVVHLSMPILIGAGNIDVSDDNFFDQSFADTELTVENSAFFVVEPGLQLEFNITRFLRIGGGLTYRWIQGLDLENLTESDLTGYAGVLSVRLGRF